MNSNLKTLLTAATLTAAALTTGCATVTRGSTQAVGVSSSPSGALVTASSGSACKAPCALTLKRNQPHSLTAKLPGFPDEHAQIVPSVSGGGGAAFAGNLLVGGGVGAVVDLASGAMYDLNPSQVMFHFREDISYRQ